MKEEKQSFEKVLSKEQIKELYSRCKYNSEDQESFFEASSFVNGVALVCCGDLDMEWGSQQTNLIDDKGRFIEVFLNKKIMYSEGQIVNSDTQDMGNYSFEIKRISDSSFYAIKVTRYSSKRDEETIETTFVINSDKKVIASFEDSNTWGNEFEGYKNCNVYTERDFFFVDDRREYLVFSQKLMVYSNEEGFIDKHLDGIAPGAYEELMRDYDPYFDADSSDCDFEVEHIFYDSPKHKIFSEYYRTLYGIIDCKISSAKQLLPFTDSKPYIYEIIRKRQDKESELERWRIYGEGWGYDNEKFYGCVLSNNFLEYPPRVCGLTIEYISRYYPKTLKKAVEKGLILIPNKLLDKLGNNELIRQIRIEQECHLEYSKILSVDDVVRSNEKYGVVSSFQGKTITQIVYSKGGTKHLVRLLRASDLEIDTDVISELLSNASNEMEEKCYGILLSVVEDIECQKEEYENWCKQQMDDYIDREANREFDDMMNEMDAWGNID